MSRRNKWIALFATVVATASGSVAGCALDDSAITSVGPGGGDASLLDGAVGGDASSDSGGTCVPKTCANYPSDCHPSLDDGCGKTIDCSAACPGGQDCIADGGFCNGPPVCKDAGAPEGNCGTLTNPGTGQTTDCGNCADSTFTCTSNTCSCGGTQCAGGSLCCVGGTPNCNAANNACCKMKTCAGDYSGTCSSTNDNGCGGNLDCSAACGGGKVCDTSNNTCCTRESVATACGTKCNTTAQDNCHMTDTCPATCSNGYTCSSNNCTCTSGKTCGSNCCANASDVCHPSGTCCTPDSMSTTCSGVCGNGVSGNCGQSVDCGTCSNNQVCKGTGCDCGTNQVVTCTSGQTCTVNGGGNGTCI